MQKLEQTSVISMLGCTTIPSTLGGIGEYGQMLERIREICHRIAYSKKIETEYKARASKGGMTPMILMRKLEDLNQEGKVRFVSSSFVKAKIRRLKIMKRPSDPDDTKFFLVALAVRASHVITTDKHLLDLHTYRNGQICIEFVKPEEYLRQCTPPSG